MPESYENHLLVAVPQLEDANFLRSVVLMLHHDQFGASGLILNRPTDVAVADIWKSEFESDTSIESARVLHLGGHVEGPLVLIHNDRDLAESVVLPGVFASTRKDSLDRIVSTPQCQWKMFNGYSGWGPGQLESEMEFGGWMTMPASADHVFSDDETLWKSVCKTLFLDVMDLPESGETDDIDPGLN